MTTERKLFGTDGIRGVANDYPMTPEVALQLGKAVARSFRNGRAPRVVIGKDTRLSGYLFENAITAGLLAGGATVFLVGPLPTPAVAHITKSFAADAGIMITASHNPAGHNGIKLFDGQGFKLPDEQEARIERMMLESLGKRGGGSDAIGKARRIDDARGRYIEFVKSTVGNASLTGLTVVLDCANGAAYSVAPTIFRELGAEVIALNDSPDGENINKGCGALHPEVVRDAVLKERADIGIALDGDADRVVLVDERGAILDGDQLLAIAALDLQRDGRLERRTVVGTDYTNRGLDATLAPAGISVIRVRNGDRYVVEELRKRGCNLGGEQTGHIIFLDHAPGGDGTLVALQILRIMRAQEKPLSELAGALQRWPQEVRSIDVAEKRPLAELPEVGAAIAEGERLLGKEGRILVRYSGTERKARIMVEAKQEGPIAGILERISGAFRAEGL